MANTAIAVRDYILFSKCLDRIVEKLERKELYSDVAEKVSFLNAYLSF